MGRKEREYLRNRKLTLLIERIGKQTGTSTKTVNNAARWAINHAENTYSKKPSEIFAYALIKMGGFDIG